MVHDVVVNKVHDFYYNSMTSESRDKENNLAYFFV